MFFVGFFLFGCLFYFFVLGYLRIELFGKGREGRGGEEGKDRIRKKRRRGIDIVLILFFCDCCGVEYFFF